MTARNSRGGIKKTGKNTQARDLANQLSGVSAVARSLGIDTRAADAMVAQTERQGSKKFAGSKEEKAYTKAQAEAGGVGVISSNQGKGLVKTADDTMTRLAPAPIVSTYGTAVGTPTTPATGGTAGAPVTTTGATTEPKQKDTAGNFVTYYNEKTGQEQTLRGDAITDANKQALEQSGYTVASADTSTDTTENPEITSLETQVTTGQTAIDGFMKKLEASLITDKELRGDIRTISQGYAARMDEARQITEQRKQTIQTLGARTGARYTGGMGGVLGGIISEEERQGLMRITEIENSKQEAIRNAKTEARNYNYNAYTKLMEQADKYQEQKVAELTALKAAQAAQDKVIAEEKKQSEYDALIGEQLAAGVTDPVELFKNLGGKVPFDMIGEVIKLMPKGPEDFTLSEGQARYDANGKLLASRAKTYAPKAPVIPGNMTAGQVSAFNSIVGKYNASPLIQASDRTVVLKNSIDQVRENPGDGATQLNLVYSYVQALDTYQSAVREGELGLVNSIDSTIGKLSNEITKIQDGQIVRPEVAKDIANAAEKLVTTIDEGARNKAKSFESQANTVGLGPQWKQYTTGFEQSYNPPPDYSGTSNADLLATDPDAAAAEETAFEDPNGIY